MIGGRADWFALLDAAMQQNLVLGQAGTREGEFALRILRERLLDRRMESQRDRKRVERLTQDLAIRRVVDGLVAHAGSAQIRLYGRGGSGKTTSLALLAQRLAERGERILILTFHLTLRADIEHLTRMMCRAAGIRSDRIVVETTMSFLISVLAALKVPIPAMEGASGSSAFDYDAIDELLGEVSVGLLGGPDDSHGDSATLRATDPDRFAWDHIFIDEAQDCTDNERDVLRALYGHRRLVIADGVDQLVRRQIACDGNRGVPEHERRLKNLDSSLRMLRNVATFVNAFARELDFPNWRIAPQEDLPGGRIIIAVGDATTPDTLLAIVDAAAKHGADPIDCLICVPARRGTEDVSRSVIVAGAAANVPVWDGTLRENRGAAPGDLKALRLVKYDSCRGLEGWITVAMDIDSFAANRIKYPNSRPADPFVDPGVIAARWLLIPLTRAVHTLVITVRDPQSTVAQQLCAAAEAMPPDVVEWIDASALATTLAPPRVVR